MRVSAVRGVKLRGDVGSWMLAAVVLLCSTLVVAADDECGPRPDRYECWLYNSKTGNYDVKYDVGKGRMCRCPSGTESEYWTTLGCPQFQGLTYKERESFQYKCVATSTERLREKRKDDTSAGQVRNAADCIDIKKDRGSSQYILRNTCKFGIHFVVETYDYFYEAGRSVDYMNGSNGIAFATSDHGKWPVIVWACAVGTSKCNANAARAAK